MSDGGRENVRGVQNSCGTSKRTKVAVKDEFAQAIARIAVSQICEGVGFQNTHQSALDTLSDVAVRYIQDVGKCANLSANSAGRSQCNLFDVIEGLEDLGYAQGYSGASDVNHCALDSGAIKDIIRFVDEAEEIPFACSVPRFPVLKESKLSPTYAQTGEAPPEHVPAWLQLFPDPKSLDLVEKKEVDSGIVKVGQVDDPRIERRPLPNFHQQLGVNGREDAAAEEKKITDRNPFLAPPLQYGEKKVSKVVLPAKFLDDTLVIPQLDHPITRFHESELDGAIEALHSRSSHHVDGEKDVVLERRDAVRFRLESGRKTLVRAASIWGESDEELDSRPVNDDEKVNGKRKSEEINNSSMNNSQEQAQL
ncbi:unnamed protein product [Cuscuta epithymum]|uniref:Bromodomain associated domain-containing protein n=1 Tax=Cuscuta epithymum TaxID=186058 RepID=A0AAV0D8G2_9ASTE|nr:unnamed protein product [Cuscuta epithymum]